MSDPMLSPSAEQPAVTKYARATAAFMAAFDIALGGTAVCRPKLLEAFLGIDQGSSGRAMLRRTGVIWLTYAAALGLAATRNRRQDWLVLVWMRAMEIPADPLWEASARGQIAKRGRVMLRATPVFNAAFTALFLAASRRSPD